MSPANTPFETGIRDLLGLLYSPEQAEAGAKTLTEIVERSAAAAKAATEKELSQDPDRSSAESQKNSALLITYADSVQSQSDDPLQALGKFLEAHVGDSIKRVHLLPFFPSSSDDGFAVIDYRRVDHRVGDWNGVTKLAKTYHLMFDLVINHCSREHLWFADFVSGRTPGKDYFITLPGNSDTSEVTRPRSSSLISDVPTYAGIRHVWTTFSADQVDLDFSNPDVLVEMIEILFFYIDRGARLIRLDAVAFLWKRLGTSCMSLQETHVVVKLLRLLVGQLDQEVLLITETNVPHEENASYYGNGDEAQGIYQFSLAPLLLYSYAFGNAGPLTDWAAQLAPLPEGCTALNFMASHDGIGLRPLEGLVDDTEVDALVEKMKTRGGFASMRDIGDGTQRPYEINISLFSAFGGKTEDLPAYLGAHALLMAFQGTPTLYIHSLLASQNDLDKVAETGRTRSINRGTLQLEALNEELAEPTSDRAVALSFLVAALRKHSRQPAFAIGASQQILNISAQVVALKRTSASQTILAVASVIPAQQTITVNALGIGEGLFFKAANSGNGGDGNDAVDVVDVLDGQSHTLRHELSLKGYQTLWLDISDLEQSS